MDHWEAKNEGEVGKNSSRWSLGWGRREGNRPIFRGFVLLLVLTSMAIFLFGPARQPSVFGQELFPDDEENWLTPKAVKEGIAGGIDYLRKSQRPDGSWEEYPGYVPGASALCLLALLSSGVAPDDPTVARGLEYLRQFPPDRQNQTYPISLQTMVFCHADPKRDLPLIQRNVGWLIERQFKTANIFRGGWSYTGENQEHSRTDNSNSQFAIFALYEAERIGLTIPEVAWREARDYWVRTQNDDGSWGYTPTNAGNKTGSGAGRGSMTCAGIAALVVTGDLSKGNAEVKGDHITCCLDKGDEMADRINRGLDWLAASFSVRHNPGMSENSDTYLFYYLYGLERTGRLTAHRFVGQHDWYREGANYLLRRKGLLAKSWKGGVDAKNLNTISTSFALLFLSKGRWPVLISKLRYEGDSRNDDSGSPKNQKSGKASGNVVRAVDSSGENGQWNLHPNDLAHLTGYAEFKWERNLIWQVIDSSRATADDYLQSPILYLTGRFSPLPADPEKKRQMVAELRGYLEQGGFLLAEALDGDQSFESGFYELMKEIFPDEESGGLHLLPPEHPIWNLEVDVPNEFLRPLYGIDFGCRTSVIFIPSDKGKGKDGGAPSVHDVKPSLSCLWELAGTEFRRGFYSPKSDAQVVAALNIGLNILAYATGRDLKFKEEIPASAAQETAKSRRSGNLFVAILDHGGGSACAPRAFPNLLKKIESDLGIPVRTTVPKIRASSPEIFQNPVLFLHGRNAFQFGVAEIENMKAYFDRGGFLFANAICASRAFTDSFKEEMGKIFPDSPLVPIPTDDPLFANVSGGYSIDKLSIRKPERREGRKIQSATSESPPELLGIQKDGRWVVVFSPYDVSCALEKSGSVECSGYTTESAFKLAVNILLYSVDRL